MPKPGWALLGQAEETKAMRQKSLRFLKLGGMSAVALVALATAFAPAPAEARIYVRGGFGGPYYGYPAYAGYPYPYYYPPYPYYYYAPPPVAYAPPSAAYPPPGPAYAPYAAPPGYAPPPPQ